MSLRQLIEKLLKGPSGDLRIQAFRYLVSGGTAFLVDTALLALLTEAFGTRYLLLWTGIAFAVGLGITYLFSIRWVFDKRNVHNRKVEVAVFALIGLIGLGLTELLMWLFAGRAGLHYLPSKLLTTALVFIWNFAAKKLLLFRNR